MRDGCGVAAADDDYGIVGLPGVAAGTIRSDGSKVAVVGNLSHTRTPTLPPASASCHVVLQ